MLYFLIGTLFGSMLFFMARIANMKLETILARYMQPQNVSKPIIVMPTIEEKKKEPSTLEEAFQQALEE